MQKAVQIKSQGLTLRGMLHTPDFFSGKIPIVCIFHGFTGHKAGPHFIFVKLSRKLEELGIASVRFDFSGSGESDGAFIDMTISKELQDAENILEYVKALDFVDKDNIGVVGLSMGGLISGILASEHKEDIKALCLWAPANNMRKVFAEDRTIEEIEAFRNKGFYDYHGFSLGFGYYNDIKGLDIRNRSAGFDKNILILHSDNDSSVPIVFSKMYLELYKDRAKRIVIEGGEHTFETVPTEKQVLEYTYKFFNEELM